MRKAALHSVNVVCVSPTCSEILQDGNPDALIQVYQLLCSLYFLPSIFFVFFDALFQNPVLKDSTDLILERIKDDSKQRHFLLVTVHFRFRLQTCAGRSLFERWTWGRSSTRSDGCKEFQGFVDLFICEPLRLMTACHYGSLPTQLMPRLSKGILV